MNILSVGYKAGHKVVCPELNEVSVEVHSEDFNKVSELNKELVSYYKRNKGTGVNSIISKINRDDYEIELSFDRKTKDISRSLDNLYLFINKTKRRL